MTQEELTKYKAIYFGIQVPDEKVAKKWEALAPLLPEQDKVHRTLLFKYGFALLASILILVTGTAGASQAAKPGEPLYPIKEFTQELTSKVNSVFETGKQTIFPPTKQIEHENKEATEESEVKKPQNQENENKKEEVGKQEVKGASEKKNQNTNQHNIKANPNFQKPKPTQKVNNGQGNDAANGNSNNNNGNKKEETGKPENPGNSNSGGSSNGKKPN